MDRALLWLACRHHILELVAKYAWMAVLGTQSKSPDEEFCKAFLKWWEETPDVPESISAENCPHIFDDADPFLVRCREELAVLAEWVQFDPVKAKMSLPRGDYEEFLQLILVFT